MKQEYKAILEELYSSEGQHGLYKLINEFMLSKMKK